jgi:hypothetical protein
MIEIFDQRFEHLPSGFEVELESLSLESATYNYVWHDEDHEFRYTRIRFRPDELVRYVDAMRALDKFYSARASGLNNEAALDRVASKEIRARVRAYSEWATGNDHLEQLYCPRHSLCGHLICLIWDPQQLETYRMSVVDDLAGPRTHGGKSFTVEVIFLP